MKKIFLFVALGLVLLAIVDFFPKQKPQKPKDAWSEKLRELEELSAWDPNLSWKDPLQPAEIKTAIQKINSPVDLGDPNWPLEEISLTAPFHHNDVAPVTSSILVNGSGIDIEFDPQSNPKAVDALFNLKREVFLPNSGRWNNIILTGKLLPGLHFTPTGPGLFQPSPYHLFILESWQMLSPFEEQEDLSDIRTRSRQNLKSSDFDHPPEDVSIYNLPDNAKQKAKAAE